MLKFFSLFFLLFFVNLRINSQNCKTYENFCSECDRDTGLCKTCYFNVFVPDKNGGCTGVKKCTKEENFCNECDSSSNLCKTCQEGYFPDENGGCSTTENCEVSYHGSCRICKKDFIFADLGNRYLNCLSTSSEELLNCKQHNMNGQCEECGEGFYLTSGDKKCIEIQNCTLSSSGICTECNNGFYLDRIDKNKCKIPEKYSVFDHCKKTEDGKTCSECVEDTYVSGDGKCIFTNFCSKANKNNYHCEECKEGYFPAKDKASCVVSKNCDIALTNSGKCSICIEGYYLNKETGECLSNKEKNDFIYCKTGNEKCEQCINGYFLGEDYKCSSSQHCAKSDEGICLECSAEYYLGTLDNKCTLVKDCIKSNVYYGCIECIKGYFFNQAEEKCISETEDEKKYKNCKISSGEICYKCRDNFYLNQLDYKCYSNEEEGDFYKCELTNKEGDICIKCQENYYLGKIDNKCSSINGCAKSETVDKCLECESHLCLNLKKGECESSSWIFEEDEGICYRCKETNKEGTACNICQDGYTLNDIGICIDEVGCEKEEENSCAQCRQNFYVNETEKSYCLNKKYGCIDTNNDGCLKCDNELNFYNCTECMDGFWLDYFNGLCFDCKSGCGKCTNRDNCGFCIEGYYTIKKETETDSYDAECGKCPKGCKICINDNDCSECFQGYYLTNEESELGNLECIPCLEGCIECQDKNYCLSCDYGYELVPVNDTIICEMNE